MWYMLTQVDHAGCSSRHTVALNFKLSGYNQWLGTTQAKAYIRPTKGETEWKKIYHVLIKKKTPSKFAFWNEQVNDYWSYQLK